MKIFLQILLAFIAMLFVEHCVAQSFHGFQGKRFYINGSISASPAIISVNENGKTNAFVINTFGNLSLNYVTGTRGVLNFNYKRYSGIADIKSTQATIFDFLSEETGARSVAHTRFFTNEFGVTFQLHLVENIAPIGPSLYVGIGLGISSLENSIQALSSNNIIQQEPFVVRYNADNKVFSPILRFGFNNHKVFADRFFYSYGVDLGINLGQIGVAVNQTTTFDEDTGVISQQDFENNTKFAIQQRIYTMNIINFRMGIGMLLF